jgi:hypothetical protein
MANTSKAKDKVENPEAHFAKPKEVVKDNILSHDEKKNALNTWEQDERQLLTASNEGMSGSQGCSTLYSESMKQQGQKI